MANKGWLRVACACLAFLFFLFYVVQTDSSARMGGGMSSGSRGSRSFSSPSRPFSPSRSYQPPSQAPGGGSTGGGLFRSMAGGMVGGLLGGMLFRGLGFGGGWGGGGVGLFDIILLALVLYVVYRFVMRRRGAVSQNTYYQGASMDASSYQPSYEPAYGPVQDGGTDLESGLRQIGQMDPSFDEAGFRDSCLDTFFKMQGAWADRDMSPVRSLLTDEMYRTTEHDAETLRQEKRINKLDNIAVRSTDIVEAWQESGRDYITVRFYANLLDYTVNEATGTVVAGSKTDPVKFEEYWTFTRVIGERVWQLSAITQPQ